jgi:hypothetical protein
MSVPIVDENIRPCTVGFPQPGDYLSGQSVRYADNVSVMAALSCALTLEEEPTAPALVTGSVVVARRMQKQPLGHTCNREDYGI